MATPDVPIAKWVGHPASYTSGRKSGQPSVIVIHVTDGAEGLTSAEDGAAYDKRRTDGTSTHFFVDANSVVQEVEIKDESHAARTKGNDIGIQIEICGKASQSVAQWDDPVSRATLLNTAQLIKELRTRGNYPLVRLNSAQLRSAWNGGKTRGICGHVDITEAFPEDHGTHTDPGPDFPWSWLFNKVKVLEGATQKKAKMFTVPDVQVPELKQGDNDADFDGYDHIKRIQRIVRADDDGDWGPKTTAAIAAFCGVSAAAAKAMTVDLYRKIYGLA